MASLPRLVPLGATPLELLRASRALPFSQARRNTSSAAKAVKSSDDSKASSGASAKNSFLHSPHFLSVTEPYMVKTYSRPKAVMTAARGSTVWDTTGKRYLDFTSGISVCSLGHTHPELSRIIALQSQKLVHCSNLFHSPSVLFLSKRLVGWTVMNEGMHDAHSAFICNSGTEANEAALKFARKVGKKLDPTGNKTEIVSFHNAFHGRTFGSLSATHTPKYQDPFGPMVPGFKVGTYNSTEGLDELVTEKTCGVIVEPIQGEGGVHVASGDFLVKLARRCREVGAVLIYDEIQCGLWRTGKFWAHCALPREAHPDIFTTAKALANGFPIGATVVNKTVANCIEVGDHGTTFGGNPLACSVAMRTLELMKPGIVHDAAAVFRSCCEELQNRFPELITEIRGKGLILGLQLSEDPKEIVDACRDEGLLILTAGKNTLRLLPPYTMTHPTIKKGFSMLKRAIERTRPGYGIKKTLGMVNESTPSAEEEEDSGHEFVTGEDGGEDFSGKDLDGSR